jgi:hypothetical protein
MVDEDDDHMQVIIAVHRGHQHVLETMTIRGVRVSVAQPLQQAVRKRSLEMVAFLVTKMGADVDQEEYGDTALTIASERDSVDMVSLLVTTLGARINRATSHRGYTPLLVSTSEIMIRCLINLGADVHAVSTKGNSLLHTHAQHGRFDTMRFLVEDMGFAMGDTNKAGTTAWNLLEAYQVKEDPEGLTRLLRVLVLHSTDFLPPKSYLDLLSSEHVNVLLRGHRLRERLPSYFARRHNVLKKVLSVLPTVLQIMVNDFEGPPTVDEKWATGLGDINILING